MHSVQKIESDKNKKNFPGKILIFMLKYDIEYKLVAAHNHNNIDTNTKFIGSILKCKTLRKLTLTKLCPSERKRLIKSMLAHAPIILIKKIKELAERRQLPARLATHALKMGALNIISNNSCSSNPEKTIFTNALKIL